MKTYRCIKEFEVENYTIEKLTLWECIWYDANYMTELKNNKDVHICLSNDIFKEYFEEVK